MAAAVTRVASKARQGQQSRRKSNTAASEPALYQRSTQLVQGDNYGRRTPLSCSSGEIRGEWMEEAALSDLIPKGKQKLEGRCDFPPTGLPGIARMALNETGCRPMQEARRMLLAPIAWQLRDESIQINYHN